jgi:hypothetical protein
VSQETLWLRHRDTSEPQAKDTSTVGSSYQRTGEERGDLEDSVLAVVNCRPCRYVNCLIYKYKC